uniref:Transposon protein, putative, Mutator sub-class n=2 Tax=Oryza sativa subsp. japonica TaxID=39947 RepID=Q10M31_ORYSJ|nr:transposon protein, putative, Mutator sub-class [Oryza sativa Japonica Group]
MSDFLIVLLSLSLSPSLSVARTQLRRGEQSADDKEWIHLIGLQGMDPSDFLPVRFHYGGEFMFSRGQLHYVAERTALSYIELDKISLPEIIGFLSDHMPVSGLLHLHWLYPGKQLSDGLRFLLDDNACIEMANHMSNNGQVAEIYVEHVAIDEGQDDNQIADWGYDMVEADDEAKSDSEAEAELHPTVVLCTDKKGKLKPRRASSQILEKPEDVDGPETNSNPEGQVSDSSDSDYRQPIEQNSSGDDEEAEQLRKFAKEIKRNIRARKLGVHSSQAVEILDDALVPENVNLEDDGSPYYNSSDDYSYEENSEGETIGWKSTNNRFDKNASVHVFSLGMAFRSSRQFKKALVKYGLTTHRHIIFPKDERDKVRATCSWPGCKWLIYGSKTSKSEWFQVASFNNEHCCPPRRDNKLVTSRIIANKYFDVIKDNPTWKVEHIKKSVLKDMLADVSISKCKRAKALVLQEALDKTRGEYSRVYDYQLELLRSNPGSTVVVTLNPDILDKKVFERFYGLLKAVAELIPRVEHRMCARHIYANWRKRYTNQKLQKKFWNCAKSSCRELFNYNRAKLVQDTPQGAKDMITTAPEHWSRAFFQLGSNCDSVDNNMCESFNNSIMDSRFFPVISMNEAIRCKVMVRIADNRTKADKWQGTICPNIFKKLKLNIERSGQCYVLWNGQHGFEVQEKEKKKYTVNLGQKTCSRRYWQLLGLPCCHAISAIYKASKQLDDYIASSFSISEYMNTYQHCLQPVEGQDKWPVSDMTKPHPPAYVKMPGRPKTQRTREPTEKPKGAKGDVGTQQSISRSSLPPSVAAPSSAPLVQQKCRKRARPA